MSIRGRQYYFNACQITYGPAWIITPKPFYDRHGYLSDQHDPALEAYLQTKGPWGCEMESLYSYMGDQKVARQHLLQAGFIENKTIT